jgi:hypothetical protein
MGNWSFVPWEEAGVVYAPHEFYFVCELSGREGGMSAMVVEISATELGCVEEVAVFGGVGEGG